MTSTPPKKRDKFLRFLVCIIAALALLTAFIYMLTDVIKDVNATQKLLIEAFLATEQEVSATTESAITTKAPAITEEIPTITEREAVSVDLSGDSLSVTNSTSYAIDEDALLSHSFEKHLFDTRPMILIFHTSPDEAYWQSGDTHVSLSHPFTDTDPSKTVVTVGEAIADVLSSAGIASLHITEPVSDVVALLDEYRRIYPSIRYCLDVRRDGIYTTDGRIVKSEGTIGNASAAQVMFAVGTDVGGKGLKWQGNLAAAYCIADMMHKAEPSSLRPILLRPESLSQQDDILHLTAFIGTTGNTLSEASSAARFFARYLALFILSNCGVS